METRKYEKMPHFLHFITEECGFGAWANKKRLIYTPFPII
jgi:hypothetical protein